MAINKTRVGFVGKSVKKWSCYREKRRLNTLNVKLHVHTRPYTAVVACASAIGAVGLTLKQKAVRGLLKVKMVGLNFKEMDPFRPVKEPHSLIVASFLEPESQPGQASFFLYGIKQDTNDTPVLHYCT